jgi:NADH-quinone oxidoreductase subunit H
MTTAELWARSRWLIAVKAVLVFAICVLSTLMAVWTERRVLAKMQLRTGPNRVGPAGLLQSLSDGVKLALKEDIIPAAADKVVFIIAPIIATAMCFMSFAVIPMTGVVNLFGHKTALQLTRSSSRRSLYSCCHIYRCVWRGSCRMVLQVLPIHFLVAYVQVHKLFHMK